jgi:hypothetical protein
MHIIRTSAELTRTQALSAAEGEGAAEISMMLFIKQNLCHKVLTMGYSLAFDESRGISKFNHEMSA